MQLCTRRFVLPGLAPLVPSGDWDHAGGDFYANPLIPQYMGWITLSLLIGLGLDLYLAWQGRWSLRTRILKIGSNLLSIVILALLVQGHSAWLAQRGASRFIPSVERFAEDVAAGWQLLGMQGFRLAFAVALFVTAIETLVLLYRLVRARLIQAASLEDLPAIDI